MNDTCYLSGKVNRTIVPFDVTKKPNEIRAVQSRLEGMLLLRLEELVHIFF